MANRDNDNTGQSTPPAGNKEMAAKENGPNDEPESEYIRAFFAGPGDGSKKSIHFHSYVYRETVTGIRQLLRSRRSLLLEMYAQDMSQLENGTCKSFDTVEDARNHYLSLQSPGFLIDNLLRSERQYVAWHRFYGLWMVSWLFAAPLAAVVLLMGRLCWEEWSSGAILEAVFFTLLACFVFYVLAFLSLVLQAWLLLLVCKHLICPVLGMQFSAPPEGTIASPGEDDTASTASAPDDRGPQ
jgi:hypothetical protein